jgi:hypothetical protein
MLRSGYLADNMNGVTMAQAGEDPPDQPASGQIRTLRRNGLTSPTPETACRFPAAEPARGAALLGEAPIGAALGGAPPAKAVLARAPLAEAVPGGAPPAEAAPGRDGGPGTRAPWFTRLSSSAILIEKHPRTWCPRAASFRW